jgi:hypothetical protein
MSDVVSSAVTLPPSRPKSYHRKSVQDNVDDDILTQQCFPTALETDLIVVLASTTLAFWAGTGKTAGKWALKTLVKKAWKPSKMAAEALLPLSTVSSFDIFAPLPHCLNMFCHH